MRRARGWAAKNSAPPGDVQIQTPEHEAAGKTFGVNDDVTPPPPGLCASVYTRSHWTEKEFKALFAETISEGQNKDSSPEQISLMKKRSRCAAGACPFP